MKPKLNAVIIGAGGVTSYMLPALKNTFDLTATIVDGDILEKHNLDRQLFKNNAVGQYKCVALLKQYNFRKNEGHAIREYFDEDMLNTEYKLFFANADVYICAVDNHPARKAVIAAAKKYKKPVVICANEYHTSQAMYFDPNLAQAYPMMDPVARYPSIGTDTSGSPLSCQGLALESDPQLAIANQVSASFGNFLLWTWHGIDADPALIDYMPVEYQSTFSRLQTITVEDIIGMEQKVS